MFRRGLFILAHQCGDTSFYPAYKKLVRNQWKPYAELKRDQEKQLRHLIEFSYENIPYYRNLFKNLGLLPRDIRTVEDLEKLPILTKNIIKEHWEEFKPANLSSMKYYSRATGGSTGTPFHYRLSKKDRFLSGALLYRGWGSGRYRLGDKMVFLAGSSLGVGTTSYLTTRAHEISRNIRKLSSYDMGEKEMRDYAGVLNAFRPKFIRGYASSLYFYAKWLKENDVSIPFPDAVFTTAEKLFPHMRETISRVFGCEVFDAYGLNDGGVSAYECSEHSGLHIDTERSVLEIVDQHGHQVDEGQGSILATSLHNFAMPFIRYSTGDASQILMDKCGCGRKTLLLHEILGREYEMLLTPEGQGVFGGFFTTQIFDNLPSVREFQVVQKEIDRLVIRIVPEQGFDEKALAYIRTKILAKSENWHIEFQFVDAIDRSRAGKYKFIINEVSHA